MADELAIKDVYESALNKINGYLNLKKDLLDNEYMELLGDTSRVVGFMRSATALVAQKRFESFLKGFSIDKEPTEEQIKKLTKYIDDEEKAEFITNTISKVLMANSSKACLVMGTIINDIIRGNKKSLNHQYLVCIHALKEFHDMDIKNFKILYDNTKDRRIFYIRLVSTICKTKNIDPASMWVTIDKSVYHQLIKKEIEVGLDIDDDSPSSGSADVDEDYRFSETGQLLYNFISRVIK